MARRSAGAGSAARREAGAHRVPRRSAVEWFRRALASENIVLLLAFAFFAAALPFAPELASPDNLQSLFLSVLPLLAITLGQTIVLITGGIDLSLTSTMALSSVAGASIMTRESGPFAGSWAVPGGLCAMLLVGAAVGLLNGLGVTLLGMPPFIVTLATMMTVSGLAIWSTHSASIAGLPAAFVAIGSGTVGPIPAPVLVVIPLALAVHLLLSRTLLGQWMYAVGHSSRVALVSGVPVRRVTMAAYVAGGLCAAVAAALYTARLETGMPTLGRELLLDVIGAAVVGGTSLFGGRGKVTGTLFGVVLFAVVARTLDLCGLQHYTIMMVKGSIILLAAALDLARRRVTGGF